MFSATKHLVAGAALALVSGLLLTGVLTQQPSHDRLPAVGPSASATAQAQPSDVAIGEPTTAADSDRVTTPDFLPGVDLVTEEVEPSVYRVLSDGVRDLDRLADLKEYPSRSILDGNVVVGLDDSVWWFDRDGFFRLGDVTVHRWPEGLSDYFRPGRADIEVGADGTIWVTAGFSEPGKYGVPGKRIRDEILSYDGQAWTSRWRGATRKRWVYGVEVQQDGSVWMAWSKQGPAGRGGGVVRAARLGDDGWDVLPGKVTTKWAPDGDMVIAEGGGSEVWLKPGFSERLRRYDGEDWVVVRTPEVGGEQRIAVGPEGTLWVGLSSECGPGTAGDQPYTACGGRSDILARFDGNEWDVYDASDGIPEMGVLYLYTGYFEGFFDIAPDRSIWFNPIGDWERTGTECDGIANFDGETVTYFMRDTCIYAMDVAPDGTVWLQAGEHRPDTASGQGRGDGQPVPVHTYVVTPEAVMTTE
jgi:hypothetical protein